MNNDLVKKLQDASREVNGELTFTSLERDTMRATLKVYVRTRPLVLNLKKGDATPSPYHFFFIKRAMPFVAILLLILASAGGTAFAAEGTLPGDILYPVKISVNEQVQSVLARSPSAKAEVHANLAERRLEEAEALATVGKLDSKITKQIQSNFSKHTAEAHTLVKDIAKTDPAEATQLSTQITASLSVNNALLKSIGDDSEDADTKQSSRLLSVTIRSSMTNISDQNDATTTLPATKKGKGVDDIDASRPASTSNIRVDTTTVAPSTTSSSTAQTHASSSTSETTSTHSDLSSTTRANTPFSSSSIHAKTAAELGSRATKNREIARNKYDAIKSSLSASTTATIESRLSDIDALVKKGNVAMNAKTYDLAFNNYSISLRLSLRLQVILKAIKRVKPSMINSLFIERGDAGEVLGTSTTSVGGVSGSAVGVPSASTSTKNGDVPIQSTSTLNVHLLETTIVSPPAERGTKKK